MQRCHDSDGLTDKIFLNLTCQRALDGFRYSLECENSAIEQSYMKGYFLKKGKKQSYLMFTFRDVLNRRFSYYPASLEPIANGQLNQPVNPAGHFFAAQHGNAFSIADPCLGWLKVL